MILENKSITNLTCYYNQSYLDLSYLTGQLSTNNDSILFCSDLLFISKKNETIRWKQIHSEQHYFILFIRVQVRIHSPESEVHIPSRWERVLFIKFGIP